MDAVISVKDLKFKYSAEGKDILDGISLEIEKGSFVAVLGRNGSGKSTLAKHFNAILQPTQGVVTVAGLDASEDDSLFQIRRRVGMVFQNPDNQIVASVVEDDVAFAPENLGIAPDEIRRRVDDALECVRMSEFRMHAPHLLSGGQKQRVAIAGVLAMQPEVLVLDEPTAMLDPVGRREIINTVTGLRRAMGITVILITHHMDECIDADRVIVMADGKIVSDGTPRTVFAQAEFLKSHGLTVPETTELLCGLRRGGVEVPIDRLSVPECADAIADILLKKDNTKCH